jgi:hypothetical protein
MGLSHDLLDVLANWHDTQPAFLIIDALDAARSARSAQTLCDLISLTTKSASHWRIVASIRKFDLRCSQEIQRLFSGDPPTEFQDLEFSEMRHVNIPKLDSKELGQACQQSEKLAVLIGSAGPALADMLRVPFNLRLMGELLGRGTTVQEFAPLQTQIELLDLYWTYRVIRDDRQSDGREIVLRRTVNEMVRARSLRTERAQVADISTSSILHGVLSSGILSEWQPPTDAIPDRSILTFSHHVLFDYAVARLLLAGEPQSLVILLASQPELVLVIRPSIVYHFQRVWLSNPARDRFWDLALRVIQAAEIPEIGKLIGPSVAAEAAAQLADFVPLLNALEDASPEVSDSAEQAFRHIVGTLLALHADASLQLVGKNAGPWCMLLEYASKTLRLPIAYSVRMLLFEVCQNPEALTAEQQRDAGATARRLLEFAWDQTPRVGRLVIHALQSVCRTFESDPVRSAALIRRCLEPTHLAEHGFEEMPRLAREVGRLIPLDPKLVEDTYRAAFAYQEPSEEPTQIGTGIIGMTSTRRQDFSLALFALAEIYSSFLSRAPVHATRALIAAMNAYVRERHLPPSGEIVEETFVFKGKQAHIRTDYSVIWDAGSPRHRDYPPKMLVDFEIYLGDLARDTERANERREMLDVLVEENRLAVVWKTLLVCGARAPDILGKEIAPLVWAIPVLTCSDTTTAAGGMLRRVFVRLERQDRERIERAILSIPESASRGSLESPERTRNRLLGCLATDHLVTDKAKRLLDELSRTHNVPPNSPLFGPIITTQSTYGEKEYLADEGVPVEEGPNQQIQSLEQPVKEFAITHQNSPPTWEEVEAILPALHSLRNELSTAEIDGVHPKQRDYAWGCLAEACQRITTSQELACDKEAGLFVRSVLLDAAKHPNPLPQPQYDAQFDDFPSWGGPSARIESAAGLTWLAHQTTCADNAVLGAIAELSRDLVPAVRFQVATRLIALRKTAPDLMWEIVERSCRDEVSRGVLQGLLGDPLWSLMASSPSRVAELTRTIYGRVMDGPGAISVREACTSIFLHLYLWQEKPLCQDLILEIVNSPAESREEAQRIILNLRELLVYGPIHPPDPIQDRVRRRAFHLMETVLGSVEGAFRELESEHRDVPFDSWSPETQEEAKLLARLADSISMEVYFASGAFEERKQDRGETSHLLDTDRKRRFLREADSLFEGLAELGLPSLVHNLLKTLESLVPLDPAGVFLRIGQIVHAGQAGGYQYESLAGDLIVRLIERYLAEYRAVLRENEKCQRTLLEVLDIFVQAGWTNARRLTYRLEEIFR